MNVAKILMYPVASMAMLMAGCAVGPDYEAPEIDMPDQWHQQLTETFTDSNDISGTWWTQLDEPVLNDLIQQACDNNPTLESAYYSLLQARYMKDYTSGQYEPSVDAVGSYSRTRSSDNGLMPMPTNPYNMHVIGFDAGWEIDLFGRIQRAVESAQASYEAEAENYYDTLVSLQAEVAAAYVELRTVQIRIQFAMGNVDSQEGMLKLAQSRFEAELVPRLDVAQAQVNVSNTRSAIPTLRSMEKAAINRLSVLLGQHPGQLYEQLSDVSDIPQLTEAIAVRMPAELLRDRPDIRRAERQLAAQVAKEGVATADLYPSFSLTGTIGFEAMDFADLTESRSRYYSFGPSFRWNILNGNRIRNQIKVEQARSGQLYAQYRSVVLMALEEVENSITDYIHESQRMDQLQQSVTAAQEAAGLAADQYKNGLTNFQNVLDAQRTLLTQEDKLAQSRGQVVQDYIRIQKALGGSRRSVEVDPMEESEQES